MPLDWLNTPLDADIGELIAQRKRGKAIETLRRQLQGRMAPPVGVRLQLADLLMQAGRIEEAVPVLLGLADEFAADGFVAKAVAILKRVERVQPGRADIADKLERLVHQQRRVSELPSRPRSAFPEFGIEEFSEGQELIVPAEELEPAGEEPQAAEPPLMELPESAPLELEPEATPPEPTPPEPTPPEPTPPEPTPAEISAEPIPEVVVPEAASEAAPEASPEVTPETEPDAPAEVMADSEPLVEAAVEAAARESASEAGASVDTPPPASDTAPSAPPAAGAESAGQAGVGGRIRRALWRFLASLPGAEEGAAAEAAAPAVPDPIVEAAVPAPEAPAPSSESTAAVGEAPPPVTVEPASVEAPPAEHAPTEPVPAQPIPAQPVPAEPPTIEPAAEVTATPELPPDTPAPEDPLSEEAFRDHLLDIVEDVLHQPAAPAPAVEMDRARVLDLARRAVASRLFKDLSDEELLAIVRGLRLHTYEPGDIVVTEGEPGQSLFTLTTGHVKVFVSNPDRRNFEVATLTEGDFFGEISSLSGRPRSATIVAASACELLELDRPTLDSIARTHARVRDVLETSYIERASSPEVAAVRAVPLPDSGTRRKAIEVLESHFGESRWDPRMRLRLADVLLKAGKEQDAIPILIGLADELARAGFADKAVAILKKIEQVQRRNVEVVNLAPLLRAEAAPPVAPPTPGAAAPPAPGPRPRPRAVTDDRFHGWLVDLVRDSVDKLHAPTAPVPVDAPVLRAYGPGLLANPLFEDFSEEELVAFIQGLKLLTFEPGDIIISEGEPGQSVFILTTGRVKVFVRGPGHASASLGVLGEGSFFGEISTLSGRPRSATITAAGVCELLELDRPALDAISASHPRVRTVLEEFSAARSADPDAARARGEHVSD
jgi:CRP-like cAMP-binding protein